MIINKNLLPEKLLKLQSETKSDGSIVFTEYSKATKLSATFVQRTYDERAFEIRFNPSHQKVLATYILIRQSEDIYYLTYSNEKESEVLRFRNLTKIKEFFENK